MNAYKIKIRKSCDLWPKYGTGQITDVKASGFGTINDY